jgi:hypothetical protein
MKAVRILPQDPHAMRNPRKRNAMTPHRSRRPTSCPISWADPIATPADHLDHAARMIATLETLQRRRHGKARARSLALWRAELVTRTLAAAPWIA